MPAVSTGNVAVAGVDVIPIEFSACYPFGGALNCYTLDIHRPDSALCSGMQLLATELFSQVFFIVVNKDIVPYGILNATQANCAISGKF